MAGHTRTVGGLNCPTASRDGSVTVPPSPPSSRSTTPTPSSPTSRAQSEEVQSDTSSRNSFAHEAIAEIGRLLGGYESLPGGWKRRKNPNWVDPPRRAVQFNDNSPNDGSLVPTEPASSTSGNSRNNNDALSDYSDDLEHHRSRFNSDYINCGKPVASIYNTPIEDIPRAQVRAERCGLFSGALHLPDRSWWMLLGENKQVVDQVLNMQDGIEQGFHLSQPQVSLDVGPIIQFTAASLFGGLVVWMVMAT